MAVDNTHTKYLKGTDKKAWQGYKEALESQRKLEGFFSKIGAPKDLKAGEEYEVPVRPQSKKKEK